MCVPLASPLRPSLALRGPCPPSARRSRRRHACFAGLLVMLLQMPSAWATTPDDAKGLWLSADGGAVIDFKPCPDKATALCGRIVWDKDAGKPTDTCGIQIAQLDKFENDAWRDGWVYDPRDKKKYKGALRIKNGDLYIRAFIGTEILGQTEQMRRVTELPATPVCKS
ncbi:DUF2147 domain-containing protein [Roseateles sp. SL47]|jgi:uncharacterized protein (DUF2147 family)|uniref:DUF2147 domain-containing protein n=1 Tax=Roseateles sp. SL47 TaxID=2995138 RepID=UPI002270167A|nr:DUF2147 domain-containing protein [Roseateles sp. SL47]WAC71763.1 DUF2147 domain-containing protein [Roseateles sp. SL47]